MVNKTPETIEIARREARLEKLISTTQDAVLFIDAESHIVRVNQAAERMFGYAPGALIGQDVTVLMPAKHADVHATYITRYEKTGVPHAIGRIRSVEAKKHNGDVFAVELSVTELNVDDEVRYAAFIRDVSGTVALQQRLLERERLAAIGTTAAIFAHEVGNPLNGIYMTTQLLERSLRQAQERENAQAGAVDKNLERLEIIKSQVERMRHLLDDFRSLSRRQKFNFQAMEVIALAREVLAVEAETSTALKVRIETDFPAGEVWILADGEKLTQVLMNLCRNGIEAMPEGGVLTVKLWEKEDRVFFLIRDTGPGFSDELDLFEPFVTTKSEGTGLGLSVVRQILAAHDGQIECSCTKGEGACFEFWLPRSGPQEEEGQDQ